MTNEEFARWLAEMQARGWARSDAECGRLLGITPRQVLNMKRKGATKQTALACSALLDSSLEAQIINRLYEALEAINAPLDLLQIVGSFKDTQSLEETLKQLEAFIEREKVR